MRPSWAVWAILSTLGAAIFALPDTGDRHFSLSSRHGPSTTDAIGVLLLVVGWAQLDVTAVRRGGGARSLSRGAVVTMGVIAVLAIGLVLWSVLGDHGGW